MFLNVFGVCCNCCILVDVLKYFEDDPSIFL